MSLNRGKLEVVCFVWVVDALCLFVNFPHILGVMVDKQCSILKANFSPLVLNLEKKKIGLFCCRLVKSSNVIPVALKVLRFVYELICSLFLCSSDARLLPSFLWIASFSWDVVFWLCGNHSIIAPTIGECMPSCLKSRVEGVAIMFFFFFFSLQLAVA